MKQKYELFCGSEDTMKSIMSKGAKALNPITHRWQVIDKLAEYEVGKTNKDETSTLYSLFSNKDLRSIAKQKSLII
jgi:hypothetical protein